MAARPPKRSKGRHRRSQRKKPQGTLQTVTIDRLGNAGDGMAGEVAVPFALPGEAVEARVAGAQGVLERVIRPSSDRQEPVCPHFGPPRACGGCQVQHVGLAASLEWKKRRLLAALHRVLDDVPEPTLFQSALGTRRRGKFALRHDGAKWQAGFRALRSHDIVPITECAVLHPNVLSAAQGFCAAAAEMGLSPAPLDLFITKSDTGLDMDVQGLDEMALTLDQREALASFAAGRDLARLSVDGVAVAAERTPQMVFGGTSVTLAPGGFLQATPDGEAFMVAKVLEAAKGARRIADLFSGMGTFSLPLTKGATVLAVDSDGPAIEALAHAAPQGLEAMRRDLMVDPLTPGELEGIDLVVFDPPRAGAAAQAKELADAAVPTIVAVSCNPDTLARDIGFFAGRYDMTALTLVDQFLFTPHIEGVAVFHRR